MVHVTTVSTNRLSRACPILLIFLSSSAMEVLTLIHYSIMQATRGTLVWFFLLLSLSIKQVPCQQSYITKCFSVQFFCVYFYPTILLLFSLLLGVFFIMICLVEHIDAVQKVGGFDEAIGHVFFALSEWQTGIVILFVGLVRSFGVADLAL